MPFREIEHQSWAKGHPAAAIDLSGSGVSPCPVRLLRLRARDFATHHAAGYGWPPLVAALAERYGVGAERVLPVSGGASLANWIACAAALDGAGGDVEAIVEKPTYEPLVRAPASLGARVRRLERRFSERFALDIDRLRRMVNERTRLLVLSDLHNPSGVRLERKALLEAARLFEALGGYVLVDEVYLECLWGDVTDSAARLVPDVAPNIIATNSLTKAYGLDGLRAGWILAPKSLVPALRRINDYLGVNGVATGERMTLAALQNLPAIRARSASLLEANLERVRQWLANEQRMAWVEPAGGTVCFPRLPAGIDSDSFARRLLRRYDTLVVPGRLFETTRHVRIGLTSTPTVLRRGLDRIDRALIEVGGRTPSARDRSRAAAS
jgi:aspartate/methionine/tyrosine aminotransferase